MRALLAAFVGLWVIFAAAVHAQETPQPDYTAWEKLAGQAEQILQSGSANDARLEAIRAEVVKWRESFRDAQGTNATRISTLKDQIAALGPVPAEGQSRSDDIAARRKALNDQLAELQAPGLNAVEAHGRADGIIQEIDRAQREQQATELLRSAPVPLNPANWKLAMQDGVTLAAGVADEVRSRFQAQGGWAGAKSWGLIVLICMVLAVLLLTRGRDWINEAPSRLSARASERTRTVVEFGVSLGQIIVPVLGVVLVVVALFSTNLFADWGRPLLVLLPPAAMTVFVGLWILRGMFPASGVATAVQDGSLPATERQRNQARFNGAILAVVLALHQYLTLAALPLGGFAGASDDKLRVPMEFSDGSAVVWHYPLLVLGGYFLFRLGNILRNIGKTTAADSDSYRRRFAAILGNLARLVAVVAAVLPLVGFTTLANAMLWPTVMTLALVGLLILLQDFATELYAMAKGGGQAARDALMPLVIGFVLALFFVPLFALVWGVRATELGEYWTRLREGISFGGITISPTGILAMMVIFAVGYSITRFVQGAMRSTVLPKTKIDAGGQNAIVAGIGYIGIILALMLAITAAGINLASLAFVAGALSLGIGFGLQNIVSNFVSGIILLIERPVTVGDWIAVGQNQGVVKRISVRSTHIQTFDRTEIVIPNSDLVTQSVTNWTRNNLSGRIIVRIGVAYGTDTRLVEKILLEIAEDQPTVLINPAPVVMFTAFGADSMDFELRAVVADINGGVGVVSNINHAIAKRFAEENIEIPFAQRDLWLRNAGDLLKPGAKAPDSSPAAPAEQADKASDDATPNRTPAPPQEAESADIADDDPVQVTGYGQERERD
ncbi:DUF3772 domain-containing protein [Paracoccus sp. DMF-8]|uniref:DUF3772 domain-containing protein n=1 Tax=Paracoccus sp. DMF-8 TaxID=3019445 RepID=UPI0023E896CA|nr:DUF3772 domain-containing protein [Paracoccus sp. DMF-8]MDF3605300.1 DUF3772 domain-containing protein [Paracoccus sp. DMF-8]